MRRLHLQRKPRRSRSLSACGWLGPGSAPTPRAHYSPLRSSRPSSSSAAAAAAGSPASVLVALHLLHLVKPQPFRFPRPPATPRHGEQKMPEAEWNDENTRIICELFAEQVRAGNRPNTHLNNMGYSKVASKFEERKQLLYTKTQLKNKWDKLKSDYINWKKLLAKGAGLGWNNAKGTIAADSDWWKNTCKDLPGAKKFRKAGIQNEDLLKVMFEFITSNGVDHSSQAACSLPSAPDSTVAARNLPSAPDSTVAAYSLPSAPDSTVNVENLDGSDNNVEANDVTQLVHNDDIRLDHNVVAQLDHESPSVRNKKRPIHVNPKENKKNKTETALLMQAQLKRIVELAEEAQSIFEKFSSQADSPGSDIHDVMALVRECGARSGSDEYFIATELFVNRDQREMFLTMETAKERLQWLRRKYNAKYRA